jgi:hypothetical protein
VDEAAEAVVALDLVDGWCRGWLPGFRGLEFEGAMRPLRVVVVDEDAQDAVEVAAVEDRQPVGAFGADGSNEPFGDGVCLRCPHGRLNDPDAAAAQHLVEAGAVVAVAVTDQDVHARRASTRRATARSRQGDTKAAITEYLKKHPGSTAGDLAKGLNLQPNSVSTRLTQMAKAGEIKKATRGYEAN